MIFAAAGLAFRDIFSAPFRAALWKSLGLSLVVLIALWFAVTALFENVVVPYLGEWAPDLPNWADGTAGFAAGLALAILLAFLIAPISAVIAGLFLDDVAEVVERDSYPGTPPGRPLPFVTGLVMSVKFLGIVILGNLLAFTLLIVPGVNIVAFLLVNGYLLGREYFDFAALRYRTEADTKAFRGRHSVLVFFAGIVIAGFLAVPILNLLTPLFAAALMVHLHQRVSAADGGLPLAAAAPATTLPPASSIG